MNSSPLQIEALFERTGQLAAENLELYKLKAIDTSAETISTISSRFIVMAVCLFSFFFLNFGVALWVGTLLGQVYYGFFILSAFYGLAGMILFFIRNRFLKMPIRNSIVQKLLN